jgi:hypothetical protein
LNRFLLPLAAFVLLLVVLLVGLKRAPESFLISPAGTVVYKHIGAMTDQVWQREFLPRVNAAPGSPAVPATPPRAPGATGPGA